MPVVRPQLLIRGAKEMPEEEVPLLIAVIKGTIKESVLGSWKNLWRKRIVYYTLQEQVEAVKSLARTGSKDALHFLQLACTPVIEEIVTKKGWAMPGSGDVPLEYPSEGYRLYHYRRIGGELGKAMSFKTGDVYYGSYGAMFEAYPDQPTSVFLDMNRGEHRIMSEAIEELEASLGQKSIQQGIS
jgi:hypothetical protein